MSDQPYSVSVLCAQLKNVLRENFPTEVQVRGELGELTQAGSGHWYFPLKDERAQLECVMFKRANALIEKPPSQGATLTLSGELSFYQGRGRLQLVVRQMLVGELGDLQRRFDALKEKLREEGLFAAERKRPIPSFVRHLGLITSESGAAMHDVIQVLGRRMPVMRISLFPVMVQGEEAAEQIRAAVAQANGYQGLEVILIARGGGSAEDLWCFNDEGLVRAIAASSLPVMTAIGHEIDYTLADFAADERAATPSAAAELLSIDGTEYLQRLAEQAAQLRRLVTDLLYSWMQECDDLHARLHKRDPCVLFRQRLEELSRQLKEGTRYYHSRLHLQLAQQQERLFAVAPHRQQQQQAVRLREVSLNLYHSMKSLLSQYGEQVRECDAALWFRQKNLLATREQRLSRWQDLIRSLSPQSILERGYSLVTDKSGRLIRDAKRVKVKDTLAVQLAAGRLDAQVQRIYDENQRQLDLRSED